MMALKYQDETPPADHLNSFQGILNQLSGMRIKFDEEVQGLLLLGSLPDTWETFRTSLSNSAPDGVMSMDLAKSGILNEEMRRRSQTSSSQSEVLITQSRGRSKNRSSSSNYNSNNRNQSRSKSRGKYKTFQCNHCGKKGHTEKYCWLLKKGHKDKDTWKKKEEDSGEDRANVTSDEFLLIEEYDTINLIDSASSWVIDSGASVHCTFKKDIFSSYTPGEFGDVRLAHEGVLKCVGIGDICLETSNGTKLTLKRVKHVPDIRLNLLSVAKLCDDGYDSLFSRNSWKLSKGSMVVARGVRHSTLYVAQAKVVKDVIHAVEPAELWHKRMCHMSEKGMAQLAK